MRNKAAEDARISAERDRGFQIWRREVLKERERRRVERTMGMEAHWREQRERWRAEREEREEARRKSEEFWKKWDSESDWERLGRQSKHGWQWNGRCWELRCD